METILCLIFPDANESLGKAGLEAVGLANLTQEKIPGASLVAGLVGSSLEPAVDQLKRCGASRIYKVESKELSQAVYATDAAAVEALCRAAKATIVVSSGTSRVNRVLPGVAQRLEGRIDTHICELNSENSTLIVNRWYYRQRMNVAMTRLHRPWFILSDPGSFAPWNGESGSVDAEVIDVEVPRREQRTKVEGFREPLAGGQTIRPDAELLLVAGAGWTKKQADGQVKLKEAENLILEFLEKTKASLGGSKSMVDLSGEGQKVLPFMTHLNQIGQTGSSPRHAKGLATCCHGEEPHVVGWRFINERRVINTDPNCGWVQGKADVVYVEDAFAVMSKVNELLAR